MALRPPNGKTSRREIKAVTLVTAMIGIIQRLLGGPKSLLGGLHAGDPDVVGHGLGGYLSLARCIWTNRGLPLRARQAGDLYRGTKVRGVGYRQRARHPSLRSAS
jgi:hypothetical protein